MLGGGGGTGKLPVLILFIPAFIIVLLILTVPQFRTIVKIESEFVYKKCMLWTVLLSSFDGYCELY